MGCDEWNEEGRRGKERGEEERRGEERGEEDRVDKSGDTAYKWPKEFTGRKEKRWDEMRWEVYEKI